MSDPRIHIRNPQRHRDQYTADLFVHGVRVGMIEKGFNQGGFGGDRYLARVDGKTVGDGRTLSDLREDLTEWVNEEEQMEEMSSGEGD